ncbi:MAG: metal ABC transporter substrate-binding protein [Lachnospiraceae bacterium]
MKKNKYLFVVVLLLTITLVSTGLTVVYVQQENEQQTKDLTVVTSFYPMYIATMNVIGDCKGVHLESLSEPKTGCLHDYQLTPQDVKLLAKADVFVVNGGGMESFLADTVEQYPKLSVVDTTDGVEILEDNAHVWMELELYQQQVQKIAEGMKKADPKNADCYQENADAYTAKVKELQKEANQLKNMVPQGEKVILFHEAFEYVAKEYGFTTSYVLDLDEERQVSAGEVADVLSQIKENHVSVIFAEELYGKTMGDTVEKESNVHVCYLDSLVRGETDADSYLKGMARNIELVKEAFAQ